MCPSPEYFAFFSKYLGHSQRLMSLTYVNSIKSSSHVYMMGGLYLWHNFSETESFFTDPFFPSLHGSSAEVIFVVFLWDWRKGACLVFLSFLLSLDLRQHFFHYSVKLTDQSSNALRQSTVALIQYLAFLGSDSHLHKYLPWQFPLSFHPLDSLKSFLKEIFYPTLFIVVSGRVDPNSIVSHYNLPHTNLNMHLVNQVCAIYISLGGKRLHKNMY